MVYINKHNEGKQLLKSCIKSRHIFMAFRALHYLTPFCFPFILKSLRFHPSYTGPAIWSHMDLYMINSVSSKGLSMYWLHVHLRTLSPSHPQGSFLFSLTRPPLLQRYHPDHPVNLKTTNELYSFSTTSLTFTFLLPHIHEVILFTFLFNIIFAENVSFLSCASL